MERISVNGVKIYPFKSVDELLVLLEDYKGILVAVHGAKILNATEETRAIINGNIGYCDGIGAVKALHKKGYKDVIRIPGCELWLEVIKRYQAEKSIYLIGGTQEVIEKTVAQLYVDFPEIRIDNYRNGFFASDEDYEALYADLKTKKPNLVFVAMGSPKQEFLMRKLFEIHPAIYQGLGGSFDVYTGEVARAPEWFIKHNLEAAYRLFRRPSRTVQYVKALPFWLNLWGNKY